ncbi:hypothetical protein ACH5RR_027550 [Cinchona calisaya]|uniref:Endonuclease/exonuclease/phosphatase domain-containing protein n=1 Tax=Cinchona calisaya TaxID=153742 RepID=A0ABD2ZAS5_9GENT
MSILCWNFQGLGNPWTVRELRRLCRSEDPDILFPMETKCNNRTIDKRFIDASVQHDGNSHRWRFTGYYGEPDTAKRKESWKNLTALASKSCRPWICMGDFNEVLEGNEKFVRGGALARARLDRACLDVHWGNLFPATKIMHKWSHASDHVPIMARLHEEVWQRHSRVRRRKDRRRFRFEATWLKNEECEGIIQRGWSTNGNNLQNIGIKGKIDSYKRGLEEWRKKSFGNAQEQIESVRKEIELLSKGEGNDQIKAETGGLKCQLEGLFDKEDITWKQRSKNHWYREGDRNTAFFHASASQRRSTNMIKSLFNTQGVYEAGGFGGDHRRTFQINIHFV